MTQSGPSEEVNVFGEPLEPCSDAPLTGYYRTGNCACGDQDAKHLVCVEVTAEFLAFSRERGNDLSSPNPEMRFTGLRPGDRWCLNVLRYREALEAGKAPRVLLRSTNREALRFVDLAAMKPGALDLS